MGEVVAGRLVIELGQVGTPDEFERRLRSALRDPTLRGETRTRVLDYGRLYECLLGTN